MFLIIFLYALCASSFTLCKAVLFYSKPIFFVAFRMIAAGIFLLGSYAWFHRDMPIITRRDVGLLIQIILFHIYFAYVFDLWALQYITSFKSSFFFNLAPFITALFSYIFFAERMTLKKWCGMIIGMLGFLPELTNQFPHEKFTAGASFFSWPDIAMIAAVSSGCYGWIVMRHGVREKGYSPFFMNGVGMLGGGTLALATSWYVEDCFVQEVVSNWPMFIVLTLLIILIINIIFYNLYGYLLKRYSATFLSFAGFICPLFAALFGALFLGEQITMSFLFSSLIVSLGLYLFYQQEMSEGHI